MATRNSFPVTKEKTTERETNPVCAPNDIPGKAKELASAVVLKAGEVASEVSNKAQDWAGNVADKAQETASAVVHKAGEVASEVSNKAQDWAGNVADKAQETASAVVRKTDGGIAAVGHQMNSLSGKVRDAASNNGAIGSAAKAVADELKAGGDYLEGHGIEAIGKDLTEVVKRHPIPSVLVGFGMGCLLGMVLFQRRS